MTAQRGHLVEAIPPVPPDGFVITGRPVRVVFADELVECDECNEPWCLTHQRHFAECPCPGPSSDVDDGWFIDDRGDCVVAWPVIRAKLINPDEPTKLVCLPPTAEEPRA